MNATVTSRGDDRPAKEVRGDIFVEIWYDDRPAKEVRGDIFLVASCTFGERSELLGLTYENSVSLADRLATSVGCEAWVQTDDGEGRVLSREERRGVLEHFTNSFNPEEQHPC